MALSFLVRVLCGTPVVSAAPLSARVSVTSRVALWPELCGSWLVSRFQGAFSVD